MQPNYSKSEVFLIKLDSLNIIFQFQNFNKKDIWLEIKNYIKQDRKKFFEDEVWMEDLGDILNLNEKKSLF